MKKIILASILTISTLSCSFANNNEGIKLNAPDLNKKETMMQAFANRKSTKECSPKEIAIQDLSDLLWAANGINRPESGKRTAPSAMNKQDVSVYVCMQDGSYLYNPKANILEFISSEDVRSADAQIVLVLVTDTNDTWAALDAGIVSQNISIFCAGANMTDYPRASMDKKKLTKALHLSGEKTLMLCHPIGYFK